jgi:Flp pilus assembly protein protease CpaA
MEIGAVFILFLGLMALIFASFTDIKKKEVPNWVCFALIVFVIGIRFFVSLFSYDWDFFIQGVLWLGIFLIIGNIFYYGRMFAGGDAKLMIALGSVIAFGSDFWFNFDKALLFLTIFLISALFYSLICSLYLVFSNWKAFHSKMGYYSKLNKKMIGALVFIGVLFFVWGFIDMVFFYMGLLIVFTPFFYVYAKSIDESVMVKKISVSKLVEGDWLYKDVKIGRRTIKASWDGLSKEEIKFLRKKLKKVMIKDGIAFVPNFLISYILWLVFVFMGIDVAGLIY